MGWREEDAAEAIKAAHLAEMDDITRTRLHGLWLLRSGQRLAHLHRGVRGAGARAGREGRSQPPESRAVEGAGRGSFDGEVLRRLTDPRLDTERVRSQLRNQQRVQALRRLGCARRVPRPRHVKEDAARQEAWKEGAQLGIRAAG